MKLHFLGANRQVTGSRYLIETPTLRVMVDCGMFQERAFLDRNWETCPLPPAQIDELLLTHAHLDHCGLLPRLVREGFRGHITTTAPTVDLCEVVLLDSAEIQMEDAIYKRKRHQREGRKEKYAEQELYTERDVHRMLPRFRAVGYSEPVRFNDCLTVRFHDAGHILGSAMLEIDMCDGDRRRKLVFSGDLGQPHKPIIGDPSYLAEADYIVMESTYGDRDHEDHGDVETQLARVVNETVARGGNVVIPTFAVERAQELVFHLGRLLEARKIPALTVYLDSPMAADITAIFDKHRAYFDAETGAMISAGRSPLKFPGLRFARSAEESKAINQARHPCIIMATAGMCNAGRIKHHLRNNISRAESTILFVGYQSPGTLGRQILDGAREVRIHGGSYLVRAQKSQIFGFSGHADRKGLLNWLSHFRRPPQKLFLTHGEESAALALADEVRATMKWNVEVPNYKDAIEL